MSDKPPPDPAELAKWHRYFAVTCFNHTWKLIEKPSRTPDDDAEMLASTFASRFHWQQIGNAKNRSIGDWQISHVYAHLKKPDVSMHFAKRSLDECLNNGVGDFALAFAYEAIARAAAIAGDAQERERAMKLANEAGKKIAEEGERDWFFKSLKTVPGA